MEPKTIIQKKVAELFPLLPKVSRKQDFWFRKHTSRHFVRSKRTVYCLECGHKWNHNSVLETTLLGCTCPKCKSKLEIKNNYHPHFSETMVTAILDCRGEFQVVRIVYIAKIFSKREKAQYFHQEVMQYWINTSGKRVTVSRRVNQLRGYSDGFSWGSPMEIRSPNSVIHNSAIANPYCIYPEMNIVPILRRNGFNGCVYDLPPHNLFQMVLTDNKAETLLKMKQGKLLQAYYQSDYQVLKFWKSILICLRNGYVFDDVSMWLDYMILLEYFQKDLFSPKYICPENLKKAHDFLLRKKRRIEAQKEKAERLREIQAHQKIYFKQKKRFFGLRFTQGDITVKPLESVSEFYEEGQVLNHCVFHSDYFKKKNSLVLSARIDNIPVETIEVSLKPLQVIQCRGMNNKSTPYHDDILNIVNSNLHQISKCK